MQQHTSHDLRVGRFVCKIIYYYRLCRCDYYYLCVILYLQIIQFVSFSSHSRLTVCLPVCRCVFSFIRRVAAAAVVVVNAVVSGNEQALICPASENAFEMVCISWTFTGCGTPHARTHTNRKLFIESFIAHVTVSFALRVQNCKHRLNTTLCVLANEVRTRLFVLYVQCLTFKYTISVVCTMLFARHSIYVSLTLCLCMPHSLYRSFSLSLRVCVCG